MGVRLAVACLAVLALTGCVKQNPDPGGFATDPTPSGNPVADGINLRLADLATPDGIPGRPALNAFSVATVDGNSVRAGVTCNPPVAGVHLLGTSNLYVREQEFLSSAVDDGTTSEIKKRTDSVETACYAMSLERLVTSFDDIGTPAYDPVRDTPLEFSEGEFDLRSAQRISVTYDPGGGGDPTGAYVDVFEIVSGGFCVEVTEVVYGVDDASNTIVGSDEEAALQAIAGRLAHA